jgi:hypothetical protein
MLQKLLSLGLAEAELYESGLIEEGVVLGITVLAIARGFCVLDPPSKGGYYRRLIHDQSVLALEVGEPCERSV